MNDITDEDLSRVLGLPAETNGNPQQPGGDFDAFVQSILLEDDLSGFAGPPESSYAPSGSASSAASSPSSLSSPAPALDPRPKCLVCGEFAARHWCYGTTSCKSCKAFFRRAIQTLSRDGRETFTCPRSGSCHISSKTWKSCRACRFQKCLDAGMSRGAVWSSEEREKNMLKRREKMAVPKSVDARFSLEDEIFIRGFFETWTNFSLGRMLNFFKHGRYETFEKYLRVIGLGSDPRTMLGEFDVVKFGEEMCRSFYSDLNDMNRFHPEDKALLIQVNYQAQIDMQESALSGAKIDTSVGMSQLLKKLNELCLTERDEISRKAMEPLRDIAGRIERDIKDSGPTVVMQDLGQWDPEAVNYSAETKRQQRVLAKRIKKWFQTVSGRDSMELLFGGDPLLISILSLVVLYSPIDLNLKKIEQVTSVQRKYIHMLRQYLSSRYEAEMAGERLFEAMAMIEDCRQIERQPL